VIPVKHARALLARLAEHYGRALAQPAPALRLTFPDAATLAAVTPESLREIGIPLGKGRAIHAIASRVAAGELKLEPSAAPEDTLARLRAIEGVGDWTAQYVAMRALGWPDAFPGTDYVLRKVLGIATVRGMNEHVSQWAPWRAYAAIHLWRRHEERKPEQEDKERDTP
jgi:AraC family transcriptional regulator of adaptative response / DNA-3-methyladenine glycosylase II